MLTVNVPDEYKLFASISVFRELYDNKQDIYYILSDFIRDVIQYRNFYSFTSIEIKSGLKEYYGFEIPEAVIKTSLKKLKLDRSDGCYYITEDSLIQKDIEFPQKLELAQQQSNNILTGLERFVVSKTSMELNQDEKDELTAQFYSFMLDGAGNKSYGEYIGAYIIKSKEEKDKMMDLKTMKEGLLLYEGLKYNSYATQGSWNTKLDVYLELEVLFSLYGFNGQLYNEITQELKQLINETNRKAKKAQGIKLFYFAETKEDIEAYFYKAQKIVEKSEAVNPSQTAMVNIVNGCNTTSDVLAKKAKFYSFLEQQNIIQCSKTDFYDQKNYSFNILHMDYASQSKDKIKSDNENYIEKLGTKLNYINILRENKNCCIFEECGSVILTNNSELLNLSYHEKNENEYKAPKAISTDYLVNKLWFKLNKGFGDNALPKTFDVIARAQLVLSAKKSNSILTSYEKLKEDYKSNEITKEQAWGVLASLRQEVKQPEEITPESVDEVLDNIICAKDVDDYIKEQHYYKEKYRTADNYTKKLITYTKEQEDELFNIKLDMDRQEKELHEANEKIKKIEENKIKNKKMIVRIVWGIIWTILCLGCYIVNKNNQQRFLNICSFLSFFMCVVEFFNLKPKLKDLFKKYFYIS